MGLKLGSLDITEAYLGSTAVSALMLGGVSVLSGVDLLPLWTAAKAAVAAGTRNAKLVVVSDSTATGFAYPSGAGTNSRQYAWPTLLGSGLLANAKADSLFSINNISGYSAYDPRLSGSGLSANGTAFTLGGPLITVADGGVFTFTPTSACDTFDVYVVTTPGSGSFAVSVGGVSKGTITATAANGLLKTTVTGVLGSAISLTATGAANVAGVIATNSAAKQISVINCGWANGKAADQAANTNPWDARKALAALAPDLTIINLNINDTIGTDQTAYAASIQSIIDTAKLSGDVLMVVATPFVVTNQSAAQQKIYGDIIRAKAASNNLKLLDMVALWGSEEAHTDRYVPDGVHFNPTGHAQVAADMMTVL
jgi:lysophospholipase L1-like esterase